MLLIKFCLKFIENHNSVTLLLISVIFLTLLYFSNILRVCYYVWKIPGPRAYPLIGNALTFVGPHAEVTQRCVDIMKDYAPISRIWLGPVPFVILTKPDHIQEILNNSNGLEKAWLMKHIGQNMLGDSIIIADVPKWKYNRSIVVRGFSPVLLKSYLKIFVEKSTILAEKLEKELNGKSFDIRDYLARTTMDSVCGSTMGVNINAHERDSSYFHAMESSLHLVFDRGFNPWQYPDMIYRFTKQSKQLKQNMDIIFGLAGKVISEKQNKVIPQITKNLDEIKDVKKNVFQKPLLDFLLDFMKNEPEFTDDQLRDEINLVIMAAYETSANALSYVLLNLAAHKDIQEKVYDELLSVLGDPNRVIDSEDLPSLKYMEMVIKESLRMHSTVPIIIRKLTNDIEIDNVIIPKGISCIVAMWHLHNDPNIWENPEKFDPERFTPENVNKRHPYAFIPFSGGPRNCIGIKYAWMFMKTALATLLRRYEFHTDLKMHELKFEFDVSLKLVGGHQVRITSRIKN